MGVSSSSNVTHPTLISTSEFKAEASSKNAHLTNDNKRQKMHIETSICNDLKTEPQSQGPSPYTTLKTGKLWDQRPNMPGLSNMLSPTHESLLTYTAQMTGWQSADGHDPLMCQQNNEIMELSRIISQLAMANHQLASAHNTTLARMEALYMELSKERDSQKRAISPDISNNTLKRRVQNVEEETRIEEEETRKLEQRIVRLENLLAANSARQCKQISSQEDNNKLCARIEKLENTLKVKEIEEDDQLKSKESCASPEQRMGHITIDAVPEDQSAARKTDACTCYNASSSDIVINVSRIDENKHSVSIDLDRMHRRRARLRDNKQSAMKSSASEEIFISSEEIERLKSDRFECQSTNEKLLSSLMEQKNLMDKLNEDYEELKMRYATVEASLHEHIQQYDELTKHLDSAKKEIGRLLKEIDIFQSEKDIANAKISTLEQDLQKSLLEKEQIKNAESQEASKLRTQLSEEVMDKKKQIKALEDALQEIQRLKETIKTESKRENDIASDENIDITDSIVDTPESTSDANRTANMEEFKKEIILKREARQRAIAAVSSEMERLRRELSAEKEAHSKTSGLLAFLRSTHSNSQSIDLVNDDFMKSIKEQNEQKYSNESERMLKRTEAQRLTNTLKVSDELRNGIRYQIEKVDDLRYHLETDPERHQHRIRRLTEISRKTREFLNARECRTNELKDCLAQILVRLGDRNFLEVKDDEAAECGRQLEYINVLKDLYNEKLKTLIELKDSMIKELTDVKQKLEYSLKKSGNLEEELKKAEEKVDTQASEITNLESQLGLTKADCRDLQNQMSLINGLFTQMLLGASSADMDLDRLTQLLQENHDLISDIAREESTEAAALPKLLLDLVEQVEGGKAPQKQVDGENDVRNNGEIDRKEDDLQEENIAHNLPKVWRVLLELLSCHAVTSPSVSVASCSDPNSCYKSVDTPAGPTLVISVSKTYIRLKELILEKKHLEKEMNRMKQLNAHLESKLGEQERRLSMVSAELTKTWNIVGRMQAQHQQLHTHEEILRYELQQKRKMLQELKQELEYCREKWESARQKNTNTELEWRNLRREFAARKALAVHDSFNSAESGFSDERGDDTDEEEEAIEGRIRHGPRRRTRKESPRAPTSDTESEQPTDTELSESKTGSSVTLEQRTPTPETEAELDETEAKDIDLELVNAAKIVHVAENTQENLDPMDQALTNVIQNLIRIDEEELNDNIPISCEKMTFFKDPCNGLTIGTNDDARNNDATSSKINLCDRNPRSRMPTMIESWCSLPAPKKQTVISIDLSSAADNTESIKSSSMMAKISSRLRNDDSETTESENIPSPISHTPTVTIMNTTSTMSVFSIGPFPTSSVPLSSIKSVQFSTPLIVGPSNRFFAPVFGAATAEPKNSTDNFDIFSSPAQSTSTTLLTQEESTEGKEQRSFKPIESVADSDSISVDSSLSIDTNREFSTINLEPASTSKLPFKDELQKIAASSQKETATVTFTKLRTPEEVLAARADRLKRLEEQADWLMKKMNATSKRGSALCTRLEELHDVYGEPPVPPPMPDILPSRRLPSSLPDLPHQISESFADSTENTENESLNATKDDILPSNTP